jgi:fimbrial chaperone protein
MNKFLNKIRSWDSNKYLYIFLLCTMNLPNLCLAGSFYVNPVKIELSKQTKTAVISIENTSNSETTIQIKALSWTQKNGEEILTITKDLIIAPKIFKIKARSTQIVRVGMMGNAEKNDELSYRLSIEEIPAPPTPDFKGLQIALRISIPVFISGTDQSEQKINFTNFRLANEKLIFNIKNIGSIHTRITSVKLYPEENPEKIIAIHDAPIYVLPKSEQTVTMKIDNFNALNWSRMKISAQTLTGTIASDAILFAP